MAGGGLRRYPELFRIPGSRPVFALGALGRLPSGMTILGIVLATSQQTGSFASAGLLTACYGLASGLAAPVRGRAVDRLGAAPVMAVTGLGHGVGMVALAVTLAQGRTVAAGACAVVLGAALPPTGAVMRVRWTRLVDEPGLRHAAFALEAIVVDVVYVAGPLLVTLLATAVSPLAALTVAGALSVAGNAGLALLPAIRAEGRPRPDPERRHLRGALRSPGVRRVLPMAFVLEGSVLALELTVTAFALAFATRTAAGPLIALWSLASVTGGVVYGALPVRGGSTRRMVLLLVLLTVPVLALPFARNLVVVAALLAASGLCLAPAAATEFDIMQQRSPAGAVTESLTWLQSAGNAGGAAGAAAAGWAIAAGGPPAGAWLAVGLLLAGVGWTAAVVDRAAGALPAGGGARRIPP